MILCKFVRYCAISHFDIVQYKSFDIVLILWSRILMILCRTKYTISTKTCFTISASHVSKTLIIFDKILIISVMCKDRELKIFLRLDNNGVHIFLIRCNLITIYYRAKSWRHWKMTWFCTFFNSLWNWRPLKTFHAMHREWKYGRRKLISYYQKKIMIHHTDQNIIRKYLAQYQWYCEAKNDLRPIYDSHFCTVATTLLPP